MKLLRRNEFTKFKYKKLTDYSPGVICQLIMHLCYKNDIFAKPLRHNGFANTSRLELGTFTIPLAMDGQNYEKSSMAFVAIRVP